jgi:hypothetical protein
MSTPEFNAPQKIYEAVQEVIRLKHFCYRTEQTNLI